MITFPCSLVQQLRAVFRRALRLTNRDAGPDLLFAAGPDGLRVQAQNIHAAVQHHTPGDFAAEQIRLPFTFLTECEGPKAAPVTLEQESAGKAIAQWTDKKIPQLVQYDVPSGDIPVFPTIPPAMAENDSSLWQALAAAMETTELEPDSLGHRLRETVRQWRQDRGHRWPADARADGVQLSLGGRPACSQP